MTQKEITKELTTAIEKGITNYLDANPGSEVCIDWFTVLANQNIEIEKASQQQKVGA